MRELLGLVESCLHQQSESFDNRFDILLSGLSEGSDIEDFSQRNLNTAQN